jgi:AcrR family transcriptional regulator
MAAKRTRRTAEGARREILDAAEKRLRELGPDGVRLQQIASDVGVSHPAILHHFESFEGLIEQVVRRAVENLRDEIVRSLADVRDKDASTREMLERTFEVMVDKGYSRLLVWLLLSGHAPVPTEKRLQTVAEMAHRRQKRIDPKSEVPFEETLFRTLLVALVLLGEGAAGATMRESAGLSDDPDASRRFRQWLARFVSRP